MKLIQDGTGIWFSASKTGVLHGESFTYTGGFAGTGTKTLRTREVWVNHNSDGSKSQSFSATFNIAISYSGSHRSSMSVSTTASLDAIPRASGLTAFSFAGHLKNGVANTINYTVDRKSTAFRHEVQLRDGSTVVKTWDNQNTNGSSSAPLTSTEVNNLLSRMTTTTTKTFSLRVATRSSSGGSFIGSAVSRNATATVHADVKPSVTGLTISQTGNTLSSDYVQGKSKIKASFTRTAGYSASITSSSILVRVNSNNADSQTVNSNNGTTSNAIRYADTYEVIATARDGRGRENTARTTFVSKAYSGPKVTNLSISRNASERTTVDISSDGTWANLGGVNPLTLSLQRRQGTGAWANVFTDKVLTTGSFSISETSLNNNVTLSYEFKLTAKDKMGDVTEVVRTVSTQSMVLDIYKDAGVGVGKMYDTVSGGALQVGGDLSTEGVIHVNRNGNNFRFKSTDSNGYGYTSWHASDGVRKAYIGFGSAANNNFTIDNETGGDMSLRGGRLMFNGSDVMNSGSGDDGDWVKFYDGTQIWSCEKNAAHAQTESFGSWYRSGGIRFPIPVAFNGVPVFSGYVRRTSDDAQSRLLMFGHKPYSTATPNMYITSPTSSTATGYRVGVMAIGRWK